MSREVKYLLGKIFQDFRSRNQILSDIKKINSSSDEICLTLSSFNYFYDKIIINMGDDEVILAYPVSLGLYQPQVFVFPNDHKIIKDVILKNQAVMISVKTGKIRRKSNNSLLNIDYLKFIKRLTNEPIRIDESTGLEILAEMVVQNEATFELLNVLRYKQARKIAETSRKYLTDWFSELAYF